MGRHMGTWKHETATARSNTTYIFVEPARLFTAVVGKTCVAVAVRGDDAVARSVVVTSTILRGGGYGGQAEGKDGD